MTRNPYRQAGGSLDILLYGVAPTLGDQVDHLLRARLTPDVGDYAAEMPVSPAWGRLLTRVFRAGPVTAEPKSAEPNPYPLTLLRMTERTEAEEFERDRLRMKRV